MTTQDEAIIRRLLTELATEEAALGRAHTEFAEARTKYELAIRRYAAVRDMVTEELGKSPYIAGSVEWPPEAEQLLTSRPGQYRFLAMRPGDAVVDILKEVGMPLTLEEIVERLRAGGVRRMHLGEIRASESAPFTRAINAALMRTSGIEKTEDGKYRYQEIETEELPI